jgi:hypothetical protein
MHTMMNMIVPVAMILSIANAFAPSTTFVRMSTKLYQNLDADMSGNTWKPTEGRMRVSESNNQP